ncbi:class I SAM-dependent methyltransferase [Naasia aerilata]|uniref:Ubiquinone/menaquinone biosynthesis methyltransferase n=1 Tax=Naasia aerilata TaxID=1162966 RepID=A0ABN6XPN8_9MICO|nr:methyltransferase domain-containing protein [Naasia aerilata]BDZ46962.1 ubiquinone/menaquinone biosynthesis methyltransferase [Naasia aerilata]
MASPDAAFAGSIPALYERHLGSMMFAPYARELAARLADLTSGRLLEIAAGTGIVTTALRERLPSAVEIVATDLNPAMIAVATEKPGMDGVEWLPADAQELPFGDGEFDVLTSSFGVMFFPDRNAGYREAVRVLRPGGRYVFTVWDSLEHNDFTRIVNDVAEAAFPDDPPRFIPRTPFGYSDQAAIRSDVLAAGFSDVGIETVPLPCRASSPRDPAVGICQGTPLRAEIEARGGDLGAVTDAAAVAIEEAYGAGPVTSRMQALVVTAVR